MFSEERYQDFIAISADYVREVNSLVVGKDNFRVINTTALDSAVNAPFQTFGGEFLYPDFLKRGCALLFFICKAHAFLTVTKEQH